MGFEFDPRNFGIGVLAGWATAYAAYRSRHVLGEFRQSINDRAGRAQASATRSAEGRYANDLIKFSQSHHFSGSADLAKFVVEPRFIAPPPLAAPPEDVVSFDVFRVVPIAHDLPYLHASYNVNALTIAELGLGSRALALLGVPGSGRTTALQTIALWSMGLVDFTPPPDAVQDRLQAEEAALSSEERARVVKRRMTITEQAEEKLNQDGSDSVRAVNTGETPFRQLMPLYVDLANVQPWAASSGRRADPAEPLVRAVQGQVGGVTAKTAPRRLYSRLEEGRVLLLLDGLDDLPEHEQARRLPWLDAFMQAYRRNFVIITGPATGYGHLTRLGLTPVFMRPFDDEDTANLVRRNAENWNAIGGRGRITEEQIAAATVDSRSLSPLELTLRTQAIFRGQADTESAPGEWVSAYLSANGVPDERMMVLAQAAAISLETGGFTIEQFTQLDAGEAVTAPPPAPVATANPFTETAGDNDVDAIFDDDPFAAAGEAPPPLTDSPALETEGATPDRREQSKQERAAAQFLRTIEKAGLLARLPDGRYRFRHPVVTAYLTGLTLADAAPATLAEYALHPQWDTALAFASEHTAVDAAVDARLAAPPDVLHTHALRTTRWLVHAGSEATWRNTLLKRLGTLMVAPGQFPHLRERTVAALAGSRDRGALALVRQGLKHRDPDVRRLSVLLTGVFSEASAVKALAASLNDPDEDVQLAAAMALGAMAQEDAYLEMVEGLTTGGERLRQAIAEQFAAVPDEGYPVLYDAANSDDMMLRRAAMFGLRRVRAPWALLTIYDAFLSDEQWYVRSAAQQAFQEMRQEEIERLRGYPPIESIPWLREWLAVLGDQSDSLRDDPNAQSDITPDQALVLALRDGDVADRVLAALAVGQLGLTAHIGALYRVALTPEDMVRDAAQRGLADLQTRLGAPLPALA